MNDDTRHDRTAELISALAAHPERPRPDDVDPGQWARLRDLAGIERDLRADAAAAPPLERDPVAALLGLIPDAHATLDQGALKRLRTATGRSVSDLATSLHGRGWDVTTSDAFRWENQSTRDVPPALIAAIAEELRTTSEALTVDASTVREALDEVTDTPRFAALAARLAGALGLSTYQAGLRLRGVAGAAVNRGDTPTTEQWLDTLDNYVGAIERRRER